SLGFITETLINGQQARLKIKGRLTRSSGGNGNATATRSSNVNGNEIEYSLPRSRRDRDSKPQNVESSERITSCNFRSGNEFSFTQVGDDFKLGRWMSLYSFLSHGSESRSHFSTIPDTHGRSMCSSLYESHNPVSTHLLRSTMIAESVLFSSDKDASEGSTSAVENNVSYDLMSRINYLRMPGVSVDGKPGICLEPYLLHEKILWWRILYSTEELAGVSVTFQKSLFHRGACWRLCDRIEFPSKDKIQHAL
ncbi:LOW QUALITY PROTEIN: hypothetical protein HID58_013338, partial [Brassica napus]